jgi:hypothetical protein
MKVNLTKKLLLLTVIALATSSLLVQGAIRTPNRITPISQATNQSFKGIPAEAQLTSRVNVAKILPSTPIIQAPNLGSPSHARIADSLAPSGTWQTDASRTIVTSSAGPKFASNGATEQNCFCTPPDVQVAAGPSHVVEMVNLQGQVFDKNGNLLQTFTLASFFNAGTDFISDPKILFDNPSQRWFSSILDVKNTTISSVDLAVSASSDPTGVWNIYKLNTNGHLPDQPILGINDDKVVSSVNIYQSLSSGPFLGAQFWALSKSDLTAGLTSPRTEVFGPFADQESIHPVQSQSSTTIEYMVSTGAGDLSFNSTFFRLYSLAGIPPSATYQVSLMRFTNPMHGPQAGSQPSTTGSMIDTGDWRVLDAAWFQGRLWFTLDDSCTAYFPFYFNNFQSCLHLVQVDTSSTTVRQDLFLGDLFTDYYYGALRFDNSGNMGLIYGFSNGGKTYPSLAISGQGASDPVNTMRQRMTVISGSATDETRRYGDYFGAGLDPDGSTIWVAGEYHTSSNMGPCGLFGATVSCWSTFIDSFKVSSLSTIPARGSFSQSFSFTGINASISASFTANSTNVRTILGSASLVAVNATTGANIYTSSNTGMALQYGDPGWASYIVDLPSNPYWTAFHCYVYVTSPAPSSLGGPPPGCEMIRTPDIDHDGMVDQTDYNFVASRYGTTPSSSNWDPRADLAAIGIVTLNDVSIESANIGVAVILPPILMSTNSTSLTVQVNSSVGAKLTLQEDGNQGFSGNAALSISTSPGGLSCSLNPTSVFIPLTTSGSASSTLTCSPTTATLARNYTVTLSAQTSFFTQSMYAIVHVLDFSLSASPASLTVPKGTTGASTINVQSLNRFAGTVTLAFSISPVVSKGPGVALSPTSVTIGSGGQATSSLTVSTNSNTAKGSYTITVTATSGSIVHTTTILLTIS